MATPDAEPRPRDEWEPEARSLREGRRDLLLFLGLVRPSWRPGAAALALALGIAALGSLLPLGSKALIDGVLLRQGFPALERFLAAAGAGTAAPGVVAALGSLPVLLGLLAAGGLATALLELAQQALLFRFQQESGFRLQSLLFESVLRFPLARLRRNRAGYLASRISADVDVLQRLFAEIAVDAVRSLLFVLFGLAVLLALSPRMTLVAALFLPVSFAVSLAAAGRQRRAARDEMEAQAAASGDLHEVLAGVETVKSHAAEERESARMRRRLRQLVVARTRSRMLGLLSGHAVRGLHFLATLAVMGVGALEYRRGGLTVGELVAFTAYMALLSGAMRDLALLNQTLQPFRAALERVAALLREAPEALPAAAGAGRTLPHVTGEIVAERVAFAYEGHRPVLDGVSFRLGPGRMTALVGPSGVGKSTLVSLLLKLQRPTGGALRLDGVDFGDLDTRWLRRQVGYVSQEVFLFRDTLARNIAYGRPGASHAEIAEAARLAGIHDEIQALPGGYETVVGERGATLSAGQRQRIGIARAFLQRPPILLLDEPTAALDAAGEAHIGDYLASLARGRTVLVITHRGPLAALAEQVLTLEGGRLRGRD